MEHKKCRVCEQTKHVSHFYQRATSSDGYYSECIECRKDINAKLYLERQEERKDAAKAYYHASKEPDFRKKMASKRWAKRNRAHLNAYNRELYARRKARLAEIRAREAKEAHGEPDDSFKNGGAEE